RIVSRTTRPRRSRAEPVQRMTNHDGGFTRRPVAQAFRPAGCAALAALTARGESLASHRDGRGAPPARRDDREYREYLSEEQRSWRGCIARRMQPAFHHGLLESVAKLKRQNSPPRRTQRTQRSKPEENKVFPPCPRPPLWWRAE